MSIEKIKLCVALYVSDKDGTTGAWKSFNLLSPDDIEELKMFIEIAGSEPENLGDYNLFKKVIEFKKEKK